MSLSETQLSKRIDDATYLTAQFLQLLVHINDLRKNKGLSLGEIEQILKDSSNNGGHKSKETVNDSVKTLKNTLISKKFV